MENGVSINGELSYLSCLFGVMVSVVMLIDLSIVTIKLPRVQGKYSVQ